MILSHFNISIVLLHFKFLPEQHSTYGISNFNCILHCHKLTGYVSGPMQVSTYKVKNLLHTIKQGSTEPFAKGDPHNFFFRLRRHCMRMMMTAIVATTTMTTTDLAATTATCSVLDAVGVDVVLVEG